MSIEWPIIKLTAHEFGIKNERSSQGTNLAAYAASDQDSEFPIVIHPLKIQAQLNCPGIFKY